MKNRKRKVALASMAALLSSAILAGCESKGTTGSYQPAQAGDQATAITFYGGWTGADLEKMQGLVDDYNKSQGKVKVDFTSLQWSDMFTKFLADYQAGASPDVVAMHTFEMGQFANMGVLDPDAVASMGLEKGDYVKAAWDGCKYDGTMYGVPIDLNMHAVYYNKDQFSKAGIQSLPSTGQEFIEAAQKLTIDENGKNALEKDFDKNHIKQYGLGFLQNHHAFYQIYALMNQQGYQPFTDHMESLSLDQDKAKKAIQFIEDLLYRYHVAPIGEKSPIDDFKAGNVAMAVDGNWQLSGLGQVGFQWDTMPYPKVFEEKAVWGAAELLAFPASKSPDKNKQVAARDFVKWLSQNSAKWALSGQIPANIKAQKESEKLPGIDAYYAQLDDVKFLPAHPMAVSLFSSKAPSPILTLAQDATLNDQAPADIVKQFEKNFNKILKNK